MSLFLTSFLGTIDFASSWNGAWNSVSGQLAGLMKLMGYIGAILVVIGIGGYLWERRRSSGGGNHQKLIWTIIFGAVLSGPGVMIPILLTLADFVVNGIVAAYQTYGA